MGILDRAVKLGPRLIGRGSVRQKAIMAGSIWGSTYGINKYIDHQQENRRAYYGEERYNSYYGNSVDSAKALVGVMGAYFGAMAIFDRDPISRIKNHASYAFGAGRRLRNRINRGSLTRPSLSIAKGPMQGQKLYGAVYGGAASERMKAVYEKIRVAPRVGLGQAAMYSSLLGTGIGVNYGIVGPAVGGMAAVGAGILAAKGAQGVGKLLVGTGAEVLPNTLAMGVGGTAGYMVGSRNNNMMAEGTITDFAESGSPIRNMNFSTAGLTLALHKNNRKF